MGSLGDGPCGPASRHGLPSPAATHSIQLCAATVATSAVNGQDVFWLIDQSLSDYTTFPHINSNLKPPSAGYS